MRLYPYALQPRCMGPGKLGEQFSGKENPNVERLVDTANFQRSSIAVADLKPAKISTGNYNIPKYTRNRLIGKTGVKNNDFSFIVLEQVGHKKAIIGSYSAHATTLGENMEVECRLSRLLAAENGSDII